MHRAHDCADAFCTRREDDQVRAAVAESQAQQQAQTVALQKQVNEIQPAWHDYMSNFQNKFRLGALAYLDYSLYTHTGFGPQFLENENPPGPGNDGFNAFDISRVYLNTYFTPTDEVTFRFTPEIYRANGANAESAKSMLASMSASVDTSYTNPTAPKTAPKKKK